MTTNGFSKSNLLGQDGSGYVQKGFLLNGKEVVVKSLKAEVKIISRVHLKPLVSLVGYCITGSQNKTMEFHLHGKGQPTIIWPTRMIIDIGAAKGLAYLHED
ncbi:Proline-rich receptor-like protein kinase PERK5, partial [Bienertia sinuspersici]